MPTPETRQEIIAEALRILEEDRQILLDTARCTYQRVAEFNAWAARLRGAHASDKNWPEVRAVIAPWPWDDASHAADLLRQAEEAAAQQAKATGPNP